MPKHLQKSLQDYLSKIKRSSSNNQLSSSKNWILKGCKHPKTLSFSQNNDDGNKDAATLADIDRFLYENFRSLYIQDNEDDKKKGKVEEEEEEEESDRDKSLNGILLLESRRFIEPPSDLCGSHRFFMAPGTSSSLIDEARNSLTISQDMGSTSTSTSSTSKILNVNHESSTVSKDSMEDITFPDDCIAILAATPNPYNDFRRSMQEMVEARLQHNAKVDWDFMEELLFCYLNLNAKKSYKHILRAFVDLVVLLRQNSIKVPARSRKFQITTKERRRRMRQVT